MTEIINSYLISEINILNIHLSKSLINEYEFYGKYTLIIYASNVGEIIGMWFGLSFVDIWDIIVFLSKLMIRYYTKIYNIFICIAIKINEIILKIPFITKILYTIYISAKNANIRRLIKIIALLIFIYQITIVTMDYLTYRTKVEVDIVTTDTRKSNFEAVSVCYGKLDIIRFERTKYDIFNCTQSMDLIDCLILIKKSRDNVLKYIQTFFSIKSRNLFRSPSTWLEGIPNASPAISRIPSG